MPSQATPAGAPARPPRVQTGVEGFDDILGGGFPARRLYLLQGEAGAGKTTLALQFLLEGVERGEASLYVTLSAPREELEDIAGSHGWSLDGLSVLEVGSGPAAEELQTTLYEPAEF